MTGAEMEGMGIRGETRRSCRWTFPPRWSDSKEARKESSEAGPQI